MNIQRPGFICYCSHTLDRQKSCQKVFTGYILVFLYYFQYQLIIPNPRENWTTVAFSSCGPYDNTQQRGHFSKCTLHDDIQSWWRHQMDTPSALLAICVGKSPVPGEFPTLRPVTRSCDAYFDLRPNKRLSKQLWGWWFETSSRPLWRHRNDGRLLRWPFGC